MPQDSINAAVNENDADVYKAKIVSANLASSSLKWGRAYLGGVRGQWEATLDAAQQLQHAITPPEISDRIRTSKLARELRTTAQRAASIAMDTAAIYVFLGTKWVEQFNNHK